MILKRLRLENIRSYTDGEIDFPNGVVLLSGDIGAGKSSVLLAIEFALFGILRGDLSGGSLLRYGKGEGSVELHFSIDGRDAVIRRHLKKGHNGIKQDAGHIIVDGVRTDGTAVELKNRILSLLGYPDELLTKQRSMIYRYTVYTPQEAMKHILFEEKEERLNTLRQVFGIDKYKRISENLSIATRKIREDKKEITGKISDLPRIKEEISRKDESIASLRKKLSAISPILISKRDSLAREKLRLSELEKEATQLSLEKKKHSVKSALLSEKRSQRALLEKEVADLSRRISDELSKASALKVSETIPDTSAIESEISGKEEEHFSMRNKKSALSVRISSLTREIDSKRKELSRRAGVDAKESERILSELLLKTGRRDDVERRIAELGNLMDELSKRIGERDFRKSEIDRISGKIRDLDSCPLCLQPVALHHKREISEKHRIELNSISSALESLSSDKESKEAVLDSLRKELKEIESAEKEVRALDVRIENLRKERKEAMQLETEIAALLSEKAKHEREFLSISDEAIIALEGFLAERKQALKRIQEERLLLKEKEKILSIIIRLKEQKSESERKIIEISSESERLDSEISELLALIDSRKDVEAEFLAAKRSCDILLSEEKALEVEAASLGKELEMLEGSKILLSREMLEKERLAKNLERLNALHAYLDMHFAGLIASMERHVMASIHRKFGELFAKWFSLLVEDELINCRLDSEFSPIAIQNGYENDVENLSGGEKTAVALAYRLALNRVINDIVSTIKTRDLIILDEPTDGFSDEQLDRVRDVLDELGMRQVILVSHEQKIEGFVDRVIRIRKKGHESGIV